MIRIFFSMFLITVIVQRGFSQWTQTNGPQSEVSVTALMQRGSTFIAATSCGYYTSSEKDARWKLVSAFPAACCTLRGDSLFIGVAYDYTPGCDYGIKLIDLTRPDALPTDLNELEAQALAHSGRYLYAGSATSGFLRSDDNGRTWSSFNTGLIRNQQNQYNVHSVEVTDQFIYAGTEFGIFRNTPALDHWVLIKAGELFYDKSVIRVMDDTLYVAIGKDLFVSYDHGDHLNSWFTAPSKITSLLKTGDQFFITTTADGILRSDNTGVDWEPMNQGLTDLKVKIIALDDTTLFCGTNSGGVFCFRDNQWLSQNAGIICSSIHSMAVTTKGLMANDDRNIFRSGKGSDWTKVSPDVTFDFYSSLGSNRDTVFLSVYHDTLATPENLHFILFSPDNGNTWNRLPGQVPYTGDDSYKIIVSGNRLYAYEADKMFYTDDLGLDWTELSLNPQLYNMFKSVVVYNSVPIAALWGDAKIYKADPVSGWVLSNNGIPAAREISALMYCEGALIAYSGGGAGTFASFDSGNNWMFTGDGSVLNAYQINDFAGYGRHLFVATEKGIYFTSNYGNTWMEWNSGLKNIRTTSVKILDDTLFVGTNGNGIWKQPISGIPLIVPEDVPTADRLDIFPNPAADYFILQGKPASCEVLIVYDLTGKQVLRLKNYAGSRIDISSLPQGVYGVTAQTGTGFQIGKLIVFR